MDAVMGQGTCGVRDYHCPNADLFDTFILYDIDGTIFPERPEAHPYHASTAAQFLVFCYHVRALRYRA